MFFKELVNNGASVNIENKFGETPLDKAKPSVADVLFGQYLLILIIIVLSYINILSFELKIHLISNILQIVTVLCKSNNFCHLLFKLMQEVPL